MGAEEATPDGPARRRSSWNLRDIVEDVAGVPIDELQDPARPPHPYLLTRPPVDGRRSSRSSPTRKPSEAPGPVEEEERDPVDRFYPPLAGATGRQLHGEEHAHHRETIAHLDVSDGPMSPGTRSYAPGPTRRPERVYLHYLLLHLDRLPDTALQYLKRSVDEEVGRREAPAEPPQKVA